MPCRWRLASESRRPCNRHVHIITPAQLGVEQKLVSAIETFKACTSAAYSSLLTATPSWMHSSDIHLQPWLSVSAVPKLKYVAPAAGLANAIAFTTSYGCAMLAQHTTPQVCYQLTPISSSCSSSSSGVHKVCTRVAVFAMQVAQHFDCLGLTTS